MSFYREVTPKTRAWWVRVVVAFALPWAGLAIVSTQTAATAAPATSGYWTRTAELQGRGGGADVPVRPTKYVSFKLNRDAIGRVLSRAPEVEESSAAIKLEVPAPNGEIVDFLVKESSVMEPRLAAQHPELQTYTGTAQDDPRTTIRIALTPRGFTASVRGEAGRQASWAVDPAVKGENGLYLSYKLSDLPANPYPLHEPAQAMERDVTRQMQQRAGEVAGAEVKLRTYRLALLNDQSYADYFGVENVLAEKVILINRVNQIYGDDLAVRLVLINDTEKLNLSTDALAIGANGPCGSQGCFTAEQLESCRSETVRSNEVALGQLVGASAYDVGHLALGRSGGGIAGLGVVGGPLKAEGCTGIATPQGDFYAIDYVAHELGHQFGGSHTFNGTQSNCESHNRGPTASVEPGSGSTVMGYAGICQQDNLQQHSDPYLSQRTITQITKRILEDHDLVNEVQNVSLGQFSADGDSFTLTVQGKTTVPIVRGGNYSEAGIKAAIDAVLAGDSAETTGAVSVAAFGYGWTFADNGFRVTFSDGSVAGKDVAPIVVNPTGSVTAMVGEMAQGGPSRNGGVSATDTGNHAPTVTAPGNALIPARTPFALTATGSDSDGDALTYVWEQNDRGGSSGQSLVSQPKVDGPLFRVFGVAAPSTPAGAIEIGSPGQNHATGDGTRVFPDMQQVLNNNTNAETGMCPEVPPDPKPGTPTGWRSVPQATVDCLSEWLPTGDYVGSSLAANSEPPTLHFRVTARDGNPAGGGTAHSDVALTVVSTTDPMFGDVVGPFRVTSKNDINNVAVAGRTERIAWSTANTNVPINDGPPLAQNVKITFSTDGGKSFPYTLAESVPNNGSAKVTWPDVATKHGRIKVEAIGNVFFAVNRADITVQPSMTAKVSASSTTLTVGQAVDAAHAVKVNASTVAGEGSTLTATATDLPAGLQLRESATSAAGTRPGTRTWALVGTPAGPPREHQVKVRVSDGKSSAEISLAVKVVGAPTAATTLRATVSSAPLAVVAGRARVGVQITPAAGANGPVEAWYGRTRLATGIAKNGKVTMTVGPFGKVGTYKVELKYLGSNTARPSTSSVQLRVVPQRAKASVTVSKKGKVRWIRVKLRTEGYTPSGKVYVVVAGKKLSGKRLANGTAKVRIPAKDVKKAGKKSVPIRVTYSSDPRTMRFTTTVERKLR